MLDKVRQPLLHRPFRRVWLGETLSLVGDYSFEVAFIWLILQETGSVATLAAVLLVQAVPRGVLLLVGGAVTDRMSPRTVMFLSHLTRGSAVTLLGLIAFADGVQVWHLYALGALTGAAEAFFWPSHREHHALAPSLRAPGPRKCAGGIRRAGIPAPRPRPRRRNGHPLRFADGHSAERRYLLPRRADRTRRAAETAVRNRGGNRQIDRRDPYRDRRRAPLRRPEPGDPYRSHADRRRRAQLQRALQRRASRTHAAASRKAHSPSGLCCPPGDLASCSAPSVPSSRAYHDAGAC